jgi:Ni2+-binding GTPase involved in maturation of urease and hydrogenase
VMADDLGKMRPVKPWVFTNLITGEGLSEVVKWIQMQVLLEKPVVVN